MVQCSRFISKLLSFLANCVLWIVLVCVYTVPLLIGFCIRCTINYAVQRRESSLTPLSPNDILLIREAPDKQPIANGGLIIKVDGKLDFVSIREQFFKLFLQTGNLDRYENLYCDIVKRCGYLYKRRIVEDFTLPRWEDHFIYKEENLTDIKKEFSAWFQEKYVEGHHALMDGYSFVHILDTMCNNQPMKLGAKEENFSRIETIQLVFSLPLVAIKYLLRHFWFKDGFPTDLPKLTEEAVLPIALASVDLQPLKMIRRKLNLKFPSIVYSLQVGALSRALADIDMKETLLSTSFPVPNHPRNKLTNHWSGGTVKIPFRENSALKRVLASNDSFNKMTGQQGPYLVWKYVAWLPWLFPAFLNYSMSFSNLSLFRYRASMSCMLQSEVEYTLMGCKVINVFHAPVMKDSFPQAVILGCSSTHSTKCDFSLFGHPALFHDQDEMDRLMGHLKSELEQLLRECDLDEINLNWKQE
ncbi:uncharacterized protein LOC118433611 isoform X2 [Folsomia candida]|uniref:uncharacterized protein LOC118433611 isoform X2 n=1 Tax=Folsomia candida TaxID=158441 RepID=UPI001604A39C|nr:uncharacterized protein LOC118433611 isoform X2 [Folsomia candida]